MAGFDDFYFFTYLPILVLVIQKLTTMKQYKLINRITNEETICTKVAIDGFDYYVSGTPNKYYEGYYVIDNSLQHTSRVMLQTGCKVVIATNNSSIDIPQIVDGVVVLQKEYCQQHTDVFTQGVRNGILIGYVEHSKTHTLSDDEVAEFFKWATDYRRHNDLEGLSKSFKELLELFKETLIKTIFYESI